MKYKIFVGFLIFVYVSFTVSIDTALEKVNELGIKHIGEQIVPPTPTQMIEYAGKKYWVIEIDYGKNIDLLVVVDDKGKIVYGNYAKDIMKIYYLNHYFYKNNNLKSFFDDVQDKLIDIKTDLDNKISQYEHIKKTTNLSLDDSKCMMYIKKVDNSISKINRDINNIDYNIKSIDDLNKLKYRINVVFDDIKSFLNELNTAKNKCDIYGDELINRYKNTKYISFVYNTLVNNVMNLDGYTSIINDWSVKLDKNKKEISNMFRNLDNLVDQYYEEFKDRMEQTKIGKERQEKLEKLKEIENLFRNLSKHSSFLKDYEIKKIQDLWQEYNKTYHDVLNYKFDNFDKEYKKIKTSLEKYIKKVTERIKEYEDQYSGNQNSSENNNMTTYYIVGILVLVLLAIFLFKGGKKKKEHNDLNQIDFDPFKM